MLTGRLTLPSELTALFALGALCAAAAPARLTAGPAPAGAIIESTAEATYDDGGAPRSVISNRVAVRVDELIDIAAASLDAGPVAARSGPAVLAFLLENAGNGPEAFTLEVETSVAGNGFDTTLDGIAVDGNGNGAYDPGVDAVLPVPRLTGSLTAGTAQTVFVIVLVPAGITDGALSAVTLTARSATGSGAPGTVIGGAGESGADAVVGLSNGVALATGQLVGNAGAVTLLKSAVVADPWGGASAVPGATITYGIEARVSGSAAVDGLVITDAIPAGTRYVANSLQLDAAALSDAPGDDAGEASDAAGIRVELGSLPGGSSATVSFAVEIEE